MSKPAWREFTIQEVIDAIEGSFGIVTAVAQRLGCSRQTVYNYINKYITVKRALGFERKRHLELAEAKSLELVRAGDGPQVRFVLSRLGKDEGWAEKLETEQIGEVVLRVVRDGTERSPKTTT